MNETFYVNNELKHLSEDYRMNAYLMDSLLDEKFREVGRSGKLYVKSDIIKAIPLNIFDYTISNFTIIYSSKDHYQVNYDLIVDDSVEVCTACWIKRDDWKLLFFQITPRT